MKKGIVKISGKEYQTVALRVSNFRSKYPDWSITTELVSATPSDVLVKASIAGPDGRVLATGLAEESRTSSKINKTSAVENCETSAIGRALACLGFGGEEYASADEVSRALESQETITDKQVAELEALATEVGANMQKFKAFLNVSALTEVLVGQYPRAVAALEAKRDAA